MVKSRLLFIILAVLAIMIGIYPLMYLITGEKIGLLTSKPDLLLASSAWWTAFYTHIFFGGISLLIGWSQFSAKWRVKYQKLHRMLGKVYLVCVTLSGLAAGYLAFYATGGLISTGGFGMLAVFWLITTWKAFLLIRSGQVDAHQRWMMRSYALAFAAVTLRIWLPLSGILGIEFIEAYRVISWLCWVPNLLFIEWVIARKLPTIKIAN